jgi:hypothetical protein
MSFQATFPSVREAVRHFRHYTWPRNVPLGVGDLLLVRIYLGLFLKVQPQLDKHGDSLYRRCLFYSGLFCPWGDEDGVTNIWFFPRPQRYAILLAI